MSEVKWIKICTDIFDDEKILLIESMPDADAVITIWFKLLCLAGKQNNSGVFMLNDKIAYTDEMFATIFRRPLNTVRMALDYFEKFGMVERLNGVVTIPNWDKHQSLDALEAKREYQKNLMRERRQKQKQLCDANGDTNSDTNVSLPDKDIDKEKDKNKSKKNNSKNDDPFLLVKDSNPKLYEALIGYEQMRKQMKKPMTAISKGMLLSKLGSFPDEDWIPMLYEAINHNWLSVYPLKNNRVITAFESNQRGGFSDEELTELLGKLE